MKRKFQQSSAEAQIKVVWVGPRTLTIRRRPKNNANVSRPPRHLAFIRRERASAEGVSVIWDTWYLSGTDSRTYKTQRVKRQVMENKTMTLENEIPTMLTNNEADKPDASGWSASLYNKTASFVYSPAFTAPVLELLAAQPGERILDVGCGSGELTKTLQDTVEQQEGGLVVGIDSSESMVAKAKTNGVMHALVGDAQEMHNYPLEDYPGFDAVFSNAALHWCKRDPLGVLVGVRSVLKPGGRIAAEMGGFMNAIGVRSALHDVVRSKGRDPEELDPWYFPSMEDYVKLLVTAGFEPTHMSLTPRITPLPTGLYDWLNLFVRSSFLRDFSDAEASEIMREVEERCRVDCRDASGKWAMMYTRLRFTAVLKQDG